MFLTQHIYLWLSPYIYVHLLFPHASTSKSSICKRLYHTIVVAWVKKVQRFLLIVYMSSRLQQLSLYRRTAVLHYDKIMTTLSLHHYYIIAYRRGSISINGPLINFTKWPWNINPTSIHIYMWISYIQAGPWEYTVRLEWTLKTDKKKETDIFVHEPITYEI